MLPAVYSLPCVLPWCTHMCGGKAGPAHKVLAFWWPRLQGAGTWMLVIACNGVQHPQGSARTPVLIAARLQVTSSPRAFTYPATDGTPPLPQKVWGWGGKNWSQWTSWWHAEPSGRSLFVEGTCFGLQNKAKIESNLVLPTALGWAHYLYKNVKQRVGTIVEPYLPSIQQHAPHHAQWLPAYVSTWPWDSIASSAVAQGAQHPAASSCKSAVPSVL